MLENIKLLLNIQDNSKDNLLSYLISNAKQKILSYTNQTEILPQMQYLVDELVILRYNKLGSEGLQSESYSGISQTFNQDIPADIKSQLNQFRRLRTL
ncbi:phage head-tail connector protein [Clostridium sp. KNHs214]|uniref:phage head-tail connector protein n=1 Tax=Clostridium sp. KNHs214 TaxID=1540257 RepID=UPI00068E7A9F|nr:phage head-tail connector protein [Clostridium sp. KNHs214]